MQFQPGWRMTLFTGVMLPLTLTLGFWQVDRAAEKRQMESAYLSKITALPVPPTATALDTPFQRIRVTGEFTNEIFLVDNQVANGKPGYWVLQVLQVRQVRQVEREQKQQQQQKQKLKHKAGAETDAVRLLVNRGHVSAPATRDTLPEVDTPAGPITLIGVVWPFTGLIPVLDDDEWPDGWPKRVQRLDVHRMAQLSDAAAAEIRLEAGQPGVLLAAPFATVLSDAKHRGYAATWFGLAIALVCLFVIYGMYAKR